MAQKILHIDASVRRDGSISRDLTAKIVAQSPDATVVYRDLANSLPLIDETWVGANFTPKDQRSEAQTAVLAQSDALVAELQAADTLVIGLPIYNFSVPTGLKAWIDLVARAGVTFRYSEDGPIGLLEGKRAIVAIASGGTEMDSDIDFAGRYIRHVLGFIGIKDVTFIRADRMAVDAEGTLINANKAIEALAA